MCGIVGIHASRDRARPDRARMRTMRDMLRHRGPDEAGEFVDDRVALGHRRLRIIDLGTGRQPLGNENGDVQLVYNGEIYNFRELRQEALDHGHTFATGTDSEVIVHLYEEYGEDVVSRLSGMFAFALWDRRKRSLMLARDRAGIKPLYYACRDGRFAFASEIRPLLCLPWVSREVDPRSLDSYLERGYVPAPRTMFRDVMKLPAGHRLNLSDHELRIDRYWSPLEISSDCGEPDELQARLVAELDRSVRAHLVSDVPLGAFLSGGLDSSIIVSLMRRHCSGTLKTFSIGIDAGNDLNEAEHARAVATHFDTEHHELVLGAAQMPALLETTVRHLDEPVSDPAAVPTYELARLARQSVTVVLTGEGADEFWAGYDVFWKGRLVANYRRLPAWVRRGLTDNVLTRVPGWSGGERLVAASGQPDYLARLTHFTDAQRRRLYTREAAASVSSVDPGEVCDHFALDSADPFRSISCDLNDSHLAERLLYKVDRMSMAHSLEARVPFLDHALVEFALSVPDRFKLRRRTTKYLLRQAFRHELPPSIGRRRKHAFDLPCAAWLRSSLAPLVDDLFARPRLADFIETEQVARLWHEHRQEHADHTARLWALMTAELWAREMLDA